MFESGVMADCYYSVECSETHVVIWGFNHPVPELAGLPRPAQSQCADEGSCPVSLAYRIPFFSSLIYSLLKDSPE